MIKYIILTIYLFIFSNCISQKKIEINSKAKKNFTKSLNYLKTNDLVNAEKFIDLAIIKQDNYLEALILKSEIYYRKNDMRNCAIYKEKSFEIDPNYSEYERYLLADIYYEFPNYDMALKHYSYIIENTKKQDLKNKIVNKIESCKFAIIELQNPQKIDIFPLNNNINSIYNEYFPSIEGDDSTLYFTRLHKSNDYNNLQEDIFVSKLDIDNNWNNTTLINNDISSKYYNEGAPSISSDSRSIVYTICSQVDGKYRENLKGYGSCDLFLSIKQGDSWSKPQNLGQKINSQYWESQPSISADGNSLYFIRAIYNKNDPSKTIQDIYYSRKNENGEWSLAEKLGKEINTDDIEESVFIHPNGQYLYFSSKGHIGMGGTDIYYSIIDENGNWTKAKNIGYPINNHLNQNSFIVNSNGNKAYFANNNDNNSDIYYFEIPDNLKPTSTNFYKGNVIDKNTTLPLNTKIELIDIENGNNFYTTHSDSINGKFLLNIPTNKDFIINISKDNYLFFSEKYNKNSLHNSNITIKLTPIKINEKIVLENIYFDFDKYNLDKKSFIELNKLLNILKKNTTIKIEISGHTDNQGAENYNIELSHKRAESVANYLIKYGIDKNKLTIKGYGAKFPRNDNNIDENRKLNRRIEIKILEI